MVGVGQHDGGGILGALHILKDHWGAVGRDLACAGYTWDDVAAKLPWDQFVSFVLYAPPGTATFHLVNGGWTADTHQLATLVEIQAWAAWTKTQAAHDGELPPDFSQERPGQAKRQAPVMTIGDYMRLAGFED